MTVKNYEIENNFLDKEVFESFRISWWLCSSGSDGRVACVSECANSGNEPRSIPNRLRDRRGFARRQDAQKNYPRSKMRPQIPWEPKVG